MKAKKPGPINQSGIEPLGNRILVKPDEVEEVTEGGIVIPTHVADRHELAASYGYVVAMGSDCYKHTISTTERLIDGVFRVAEKTTTGYSESWVKAGDRIGFRPYTGAESTGEDGERYVTINDEDVLSKVTERVTQTTLEARKPLGVK